VSEARSHRAPWEQDAHAHDPDATRVTPAVGNVFDADPPKRSWTS
jgi:hypothetical protein